MVNAENAGKHPSGAKAHVHSESLTARLKSCPFKTGLSPQAARQGISQLLLTMMEYLIPSAPDVICQVPHHARIKDWVDDFDLQDEGS